MGKLLKFLVGGLLSVWIVAPVAAGLGAIVTAFAGQVSNLDPEWNALFLVGVFLTTFGVSVAGAQVGVAALNQHGPLARAEELRRGSLASRRAIESELMTCAQVADEAVTTQIWWNYNNATLPSEKWTADHGVLVDDPNAYSACQEAYVACDVANKRSHHHVGWNEKVNDDELPMLRDTQEKIHKALGALAGETNTMISARVDPST